MVANSPTEYKQCFESWRFFVGLRFTVLGFFLSFTSALLYGVFTIPDFINSPDAKCVTAIIGIMVTWAFIMLEGRNRQLYNACLQRAKDIEQLKSNEKSYEDQTDNHSPLANKLDPLPKKIYAAHKWGIYGLYIIALLIWVGMFILNLMKIPIIGGIMTVATATILLVQTIALVWISIRAYQYTKESRKSSVFTELAQQANVINRSFSEYKIPTPYEVLIKKAPMPKGRFKERSIIFFHHMNLLTILFRNHKLLGQDILKGHISWINKIWRPWVDSDDDLKELLTYVLKNKDLYGIQFIDWLKRNMKSQ